MGQQRPALTLKLGGNIQSHVIPTSSYSTSKPTNEFPFKNIPINSRLIVRVYPDHSITLYFKNTFKGTTKYHAFKRAFTSIETAMDYCKEKRIVTKAEALKTRILAQAAFHGGNE